MAKWRLAAMAAYLSLKANRSAAISERKLAGGYQNGWHRNEIWRKEENQRNGGVTAQYQLKAKANQLRK